MCYIFRQIFPFHSELRKDKIANCLLLPLAVFLSPPTFWEACDQPEPGSFFPRMKDPGDEVGPVVAYLADMVECEQDGIIAKWSQMSKCLFSRDVVFVLVVQSLLKHLNTVRPTYRKNIPRKLYLNTLLNCKFSPEPTVRFAFFRG